MCLCVSEREMLEENMKLSNNKEKYSRQKKQGLQWASGWAILCRLVRRVSNSVNLEQGPGKVKEQVMQKLAKFSGRKNSVHEKVLLVYITINVYKTYSYILYRKCYEHFPLGLPISCFWVTIHSDTQWLKTSIVYFFSWVYVLTRLFWSGWVHFILPGLCVWHRLVG